MISESLCRVAAAASLATLLLCTGLVMPSAAQSTAVGHEGPWALNCVKIGKSKKQQCQIIQRRVDPKSRKLVLAVVIGKDPKAKAGLMRIVLPFGLYLPAGTIIAVDKNKPLKLAIETCQKTGCFASAPVSDAFLETMRRGKQMVVSFQALTRKQINVAISLKGFTAAFKRLK